MSLQPRFRQATALLKNMRGDDLALFVLRHGESTGQTNPGDYKTIGDNKLRLTDRGVRQSIAATKLLLPVIEDARLKDVEISHSTGQRATQTAQIMHEEFKRSRLIKEIDSDERIDKQKFGLFDGLFTSTERRAHRPVEYAAYEQDLRLNGPFHARPPEGESIADVQKRIKAYLEDRNSWPRPTIVVTHGTNALCFENVLMKNRGEKWVLDHMDGFPNCSIRLFVGSLSKGFAAKTLCGDPLEKPSNRPVPSSRIPVPPAR